MTKKIVPLPAAIIPFLLASIEGFDIMLEDGERIVLVPKPTAEITPAAREQLTALITKAGNGSAVELTPTIVPPRATATAPRLRFIYKVKDKRYTPEQAKAFGLSKPRLLIYTLVYAAGDAGTGYASIREKSKLAHGTVMQILHWLRKQNLIIGKEDPTAK